MRGRDVVAAVLLALGLVGTSFVVSFLVWVALVVPVLAADWLAWTAYSDRRDYNNP